MSRLTLRVAISTFVASMALATAAGAWLCEPKHVTGRHTEEARQVPAETFAQPPHDGDDADYEARVLGCNRHRDDLAKDVENSISLDHTFEADLPARLIKGHIRYLGFAPMRYGYRLERQAGEWIVVMPVEFHFPEPPFGKYPDRLDIPMDLAEKLGIDDTICASTQMAALGLHVDRGLVEDKDGFPSCRVRRDERFGGTPVTTHLMDFWRDVIREFWNRPGFKIRFRIANLGDIEASELKEYERNDVLWHIRMNHNKNSRAMYKASVGRPHPLYTGLDAATIVHEFGHALGLDDEYAETKNPSVDRICHDIGGYDYVMCLQPDHRSGSTWGAIDWTSAPEAGLPYTDTAKGLYPWIVTRRYVAGTTFNPQCLDDGDCKGDEWCDLGTLSIGRNHCKKKKEAGAGCTRPQICLSGRCPAGFCAECRKDEDCAGGEYCDRGVATVGKNHCLAKKGLNEACGRPNACKSGRCYVGKCKPQDECSKDSDCPGSGDYCDRGWLTAGVNECQAKKNIGVGCSRPEQCKSGRCYVGKCKPKDECSKDSDCPGSDDYCDRGWLTAGVNECLAKKSNNVGCSRPEQCKSGRCYVGKCKPQDDCSSDSDCPGSGDYCDKGWLTAGVNECVAKKSNGTGCTRAEQCASGRCLLGFCADEKECSKDGDCDKDDYCDKGWLTAGKNECKNEKKQGKSCSRNEQCKSKCCKLYNFKVQCRPKEKCK